jgi:cytochrome c oxidase assembly protein subunit 11
MKFSNDPVTDTTLKLMLMTLVMGASVFFVMIPLYNVLCDALGINGKTSGSAYSSISTEIDKTRFVTVQFITNNNANMPWVFEPEVTMMSVNLGAVNNTSFDATNTTNSYMIGQAIPSVSPSRAAQYFHKTECFCFESQALESKTSVEMPLAFIIDKELPKDIKTITLSYTLFDITGGK